MLLLLLAQAPPAPTAQPDVLTPALFTAAGGLLGIVITIVVQSVNSRLQRRHENQGRAFQVRLELYRDLLPKFSRVSLAREFRDDHLEDGDYDAAAIEEEVAEASKDLYRTIGPLTLFADRETMGALTAHLDAIERRSGEDEDETGFVLREEIRRELGINRRVRLTSYAAEIWHRSVRRDGAVSSNRDGSSTSGQTDDSSPRL